MYKTDKIAILLAAYNGEKYIRQQMGSLLDQTNNNWIAYIHDDGSKDRTNYIIDEYCDKYPERFIKVEGPPCGGAKENFMFLTSIVEAELYMYCDQDDVWLENKIADTLSEMMKINRENKPCLVYTDLKVVASDLSVISESMASYQGLKNNKLCINRFLIQNVVTGCTMMINKCLRDLMVKKCRLDNVIMHDWWAALISVSFGEVRYLNRSTILYRQHGDNSVGAKKILSVKNIISKIKKSDDIKRSLEATRIQAAEFNKTFRPPEESPSWIYEKIGEYNKIKRLWIYVSGGFYKSSLIRNVGLFIFG